MKDKYLRIFQQFNCGVDPDIHWKSTPLVSILMPYYNNIAYVEDCLDSILEQTYKNWELLFVNDCCPDDIQSVFAQYDDPRFHYFSLNKNSGAAAARNFAFKQSKGEYIICIDPDDIIPPDALALLVQRALSADKPDIIIYDLIKFGDATAPAYTALRVGTAETLVHENWLNGTAFVKRHIWLLTGGQSEDPVFRLGCQDYEFWLNAFEKKEDISVAGLGRAIFLYRCHGNSLSSKSEIFEYKKREALLKHHSLIFKKYKYDKLFLDEGYLISTVAQLKRFHFCEAFRILFRSGSSRVLRLLMAKFLAKLRKSIRGVAGNAG